MKEKELTLKDLDTKFGSRFGELTKTIDDLASVTAAGFTDTQKQINVLNSKFDLHDAEFKIMESRMDKGFRELQKEAEEIKLRLDKIERVTKEDILALGDEVYHIKLRTKKLEQKIAKLKLANS